MKPLPSRRPSFPLVLASALLLLGGCTLAPPSTGQPAASAAPTDASEQTVRSPSGRAAAALMVSAAQIHPGGSIKVQVANRGLTQLNYGRPVTVERWTGSVWQETPESRNAAWTMELLQVAPGRSGEEQTWPFQPGQRPTPGWYRFSKELSAEDGGGGSERLLIRTRVEVVGS